jgi:hypothetical protein
VHRLEETLFRRYVSSPREWAFGVAVVLLGGPEEEFDLVGL